MKKSILGLVSMCLSVGLSSAFAGDILHCKRYEGGPLSGMINELRVYTLESGEYEYSLSTCERYHGACFGVSDYHSTGLVTLGAYSRRPTNSFSSADVSMVTLCGEVRIVMDHKSGRKFEFHPDECTVSREGE